MKIIAENLRKKSLNLGIKLFFKNKLLKHEFLQNRIIRGLLISNLILVMADFIFLFFVLNRVDGRTILHYNVYFGVDVIGNWKQAFLMPAIGAGIFVLNALFAAFFYKNKERIASHVLLLVSLMVQICLVIAAISIALINY